jgi:RNA polymerase sigma factor (sigma-70 family)
MPSGRVEASVAHPEMTSVMESVGALSDEELIARFLNPERDEAEAAFRIMVMRHGPMVLGVCRHVLNQHQDAEDAFQATFIALARKVGTIKDRRVLARWLYEVAYRIAVRAKTSAVRKRNRERQGAEMSVTAAQNEAGWNELRPVLHEELSRLPDKYRTPVVLCYLEGKTNEEVAELLRWPVGTVKGRLSRARELLRSRLAKRGLALSAAFLVTSFSQNAVFAEVVPLRLIDATVDSALRQKRLEPAPYPLRNPASRVHVLGSQIVIATILVILATTALVSASSWIPRILPNRPEPIHSLPATDDAPGQSTCGSSA